ncbi:hypothetical protein BDN72DRAFT_455725 [Pluteus cervinus]|uniref:Uncharacterized protein n=1 Tax=Pluteus cervinus TaxID=181527 RepID=A0ACD3B0S2_9AGAR|nr:hypothetical protein BDN72DRAFT_455725 [Pluteus cervinus]
MPSAGLGEADALYPHIQRRLVESGEWDRIRSLLFTRLNDVGWIDNVKSNSKERARDMESTSARGLLQELSSSVHSSIPPAVKRDVRSQIKVFLGQEIE